MSLLGEFARRLNMLLRRNQFDADLEEEMRLHQELRQKQHVESGTAARDALAAAKRRFGNTTYLKEESHMAWGWGWIEDGIQDLSYAFRTLRKSAGFTIIAILTIALGIGATTAIFSAVNATLLHPLPFEQPEQLVSIQFDFPGIGSKNVGISVPEWRDLERSGIFDYVAIMGKGSVNLTGWSQPTRARFMAVSPNYFALLGVKAQLGRTFNPEDHTPGFTLETVISDGIWKRVFASDPAIVGKSLRLDNDLYRVVGVMPPGYHDPGRSFEERNIEVWCATNFDAAPAPPPLRKTRFLPDTMGRLKPGMTIAQAQSRVDALINSLQKEFPEDYPPESGWEARLVPLKETVIGNVRLSLILMLGAVGLVLLIGCVNVANLQLARSSSRGREMAVRQALGAGRRRLMRQLLTESLLLSLLGGVLGLVILVCTKNFLLKLVPDSLPQMNEISINWTVLLFALIASLVAGAIFGLAPALDAGRVELAHVLKQEGRGSTGSGDQARTRRVLVITEFALSLVLMIAAGLLLRSFWDLLNVRPGFNPEKVMAVRLWLPIPNDPTTDIYRTPAQEASFLHEVIRRGKTLLGVEEVAIGNMGSLPLSHDRNDLNPFPLILEGHENASQQGPIAYRSDVSPEYFHLLGIPALRGRSFTEADDDHVPRVAVVNETFALTYFPGDNPIGKRFKTPPSDGVAADTWTTVVGVVADARTESLAEAPIPLVYSSAYQRTPRDLAIFVRGRLDTAEIPVELREQVQAVNSEIPVFGAETLVEAVSDSLSERRFSMEIVGLFALTALLLAGLGIYGVISYVVSERTHEIGIRLALGAQSRNILRMVLREGLGLAAMGAGVGLVCAVAMSHLMAGVLFGVRPLDPLTFLSVALLLIMVALLACYIPARRALRVDPMIALRYE
jgi:putative ABC transport system permease protein